MGQYLSLCTLSEEDRSYFLQFIVMSNKAAAHLTGPRNHDLSIVHPTILRIHHFLKTNLYDAVGRTDLESLTERFSEISARYAEQEPRD